MKASEVLQQYAQGKRDFRGVNLRGLSFRNQDLSGADFSGADIRSTNFQGARLQGTQFVKAKAGLQKSRMILLLVFALLLVALSGFCYTLNAYFIVLIFDTSSSGSMVAGWVSLVVWVTFLIVLWHQGILAAITTVAVLVAIAVALVAVVAVDGVMAGAPTSAAAIAFDIAFTRGGTFAVAMVFVGVGMGAGAIAGAGAGAGGMALAVASTIAGIMAEIVALCCAVTVAASLSGSLAGSLSVAGSIPMAIAGALTVSITVVIAAGVNFYIARRGMKGDEKHSLIRSIAVAFAAIGGTSFQGADLTEANFTGAVLKSTDFRSANLTRTYWKKAKLLDIARPGKSILAQRTVRELLVSGKGYHQNFSKADLRGANLTHADLSYTNLTQADLSQATLQGANLEGANLTEVNAIGTNLTQAKLTAACIEAWNTDSKTQLNQIQCDFIYLLNHQQERRPSSGIFTPGEFTQLFQEVFNTVDLIFKDGVNWKAFVSAFKQVKVENEKTELDIQSIENKGDGVIIVKVNVPPHSDKEKIHASFTQNYQLKLQALEREYKAQLKIKDSQIESYKRESVNLMEVTKLLASRPINNNAVANSESASRHIQGGSGNYSETHVKEQNTYIENQYSQAEQEILTKAADDIQQLLNQLSQTYPINTSTEKMTVAIKAIHEVEKNFSLSERIISALRVGGIQALRQMLEHPAATFVLSAIDDWYKVKNQK
jgi:uncharacterized protein YjbI with pentapeptide repeats